MSTLVVLTSERHPYYPTRKFSLKKLTGTQPGFKLGGCTTDSGGGGTGHSLHRHMDDLQLCVSADAYLVGFCCLHTLQLTLCGALNNTIGAGGIENRNALQLIHAAYDLQNNLGFEMWKGYYKEAIKVVQPGNDSNEFDESLITKLTEPIPTRWWTIGEGANNILKNLAVILQIAKQVRNVYSSGSHSNNKVASRFISLLNEPIIISDVKLIAGFHAAFLNTHFAWLQKGDKDVGNAPGFLGRLMLTQYFLMSSDLSRLQNRGWADIEEMKPFANSLDEDIMKIEMIDPQDPSKTRMIMRKSFQENKAQLFFEAAKEKLDKHYVRFVKDLLFLSLYGERCSTQVVSTFLFGDKDHTYPSPSDEFFSPAHKRLINLNDFSTFLKAKIENVEERKNCIKMKLINRDVLNKLIGKFLS